MKVNIVCILLFLSVTWAYSISIYLRMGWEHNNMFTLCCTKLSLNPFFPPTPSHMAADHQDSYIICDLWLSTNSVYIFCMEMSIMLTSCSEFEQNVSLVFSMPKFRIMNYFFPLRRNKYQMNWIMHNHENNQLVSNPRWRRSSF